MAFNKQSFSSSRDRNHSRSGGGFRSRPSFSAKGGPASGWGDRPRFGGREDRGPVEMHKAVCDNCGRGCEVPFRPTSGKPVYCSNCFENQRQGGRNPERAENGFAEINAKLDNILMLLENQKPVKKAKVEEVASV